MPHRYYTRRFLNRRRQHAGAYVLALVENTAKRPDDRTWADLELTMADCGARPSLSFSADPDELGNSFSKLDVLMDTLGKFRSALEAEGRLAAEREECTRAKRKAAEGA